MCIMKKSWIPKRRHQEKVSYRWLSRDLRVYMRPREYGFIERMRKREMSVIKGLRTNFDVYRGVLVYG